jgi:hypothetical protein
MPGGPVTSATPPRPDSAAAKASRSAWSASPRPTNAALPAATGVRTGADGCGGAPGASATTSPAKR